MNTLELQTESILQVPIQKYNKNFTFIVNSKKYETSSICADLLSPIISSRHLIDPTINEYTINTETSGDFNLIINIGNFIPQSIKDDDFSFIIEVFEKLGTEKVTIKIKDTNYELNNDNIFEYIIKHQKHPNFFKKELENEIHYISSHFYELKEKLIETISKEKVEIDENIIEMIISSDQLQLETEDDLLEFVNFLYLKNNKKFLNFYEFVDFKNIEIESIKKFIEIFDINDITNSIWSSIVSRLRQPIINDIENRTYKHQIHIKYFKIIEFENNRNKFNGILNYLQNNFNIKDELDITSSSHYSGDPFNLLKFDDANNSYSTDNFQNSWICFEFINHEIVPSHYVIRSYDQDINDHLKSWVLEGSNDKINWTKIDEQKDNPSLNGARRVQVFAVSNNQDKPFKYIRILQTGKTWAKRNYLLINSIEFYGKLI